MSDNHTNQPPVDTRLPEELARCESILAGMSLPRSRVQRDELMYRAGWAAAEGDANCPSLQGAERKQYSRGTGGRSTFAWAIASAAIAASLTAAITLWLEPAAVAPTDAIVDLSSEEGSAISEEEKQPPESRAHLIPGGSTRRVGIEWTASLLTMRNRALSQQWDDPWIATETSIGESSSNDAISSQPKTSREMLQEFLPEPSAQDTSDRDSTRDQLRWLWKTMHLRETI